MVPGEFWGKMAFGAKVLESLTVSWKWPRDNFRGPKQNKTWSLDAPGPGSDRRVVKVSKIVCVTGN